MKKYTRSELLRGLVHSGLGQLAEAVGRQVGALIPDRPRPPWAIDEAAFIGTCENCRSCAEYCPKGIILHHGREAQLSAHTPYLDFSRDYCDFCGECVKVCPSGALSFDKGKKEIGTVCLDPYLCTNSDSENPPCRTCIDACPEKALSQEGQNIPIVSSEGCNGCGACVPVCPRVITIKRSLF